MNVGNKGRGTYIVFEGIIKCGKSTQAQKVYEAAALANPNKKVIKTREPGGSEVADEIRRVVQGTKFAEEMDPVCEQYLYAASRAQTLRKIVKPVLDKGGIVIADRSYFTSLAFQGYGRGLGVEKVLKINEEAINGIKPDAVVYIDTPVEVCLSRQLDLAGDKFEAMNNEFFDKCREGYMWAANNFSNFVMVDGSGTIDEVYERVTAGLSGIGILGLSRI